MSKAACFLLPIKDKYIQWPGMAKVRCKTASQLYPHSRVGTIAELRYTDDCSE